MNRTEHLLSILAEECAEVAQRVSKALRFGLDEVQPGQELTNAQRIRQELDDLYAMEAMLQDEGLLPQMSLAAVTQKRDKVENYLLYSEACGTLTE